MKQLIPILFLSTFLATSCDNGSNYKEIRKEVIDVHDEAMHKTGIMIGNKMKLDTILMHLDSLKIKKPAIDTTRIRSEVTSLIRDLVLADDKMNDWMHEFNPDASDKSNQEAVKYFQQQLTEVKVIDSICKVELDKSNAYLLKINSN